MSTEKRFSGNWDIDSYRCGNNAVAIATSRENKKEAYAFVYINAKLVDGNVQNNGWLPFNFIMDKGILPDVTEKGQPMFNKPDSQNPDSSLAKDMSGVVLTAMPTTKISPLVIHQKIGVDSNCDTWTKESE